MTSPSEQLRPTVPRQDEPVERTMGFTEIQQWVRHRYPMNYLDRVTDYTPGEHLTALVSISGSMPVFQGHFPERAIFPSSSAMLAIAEAGVILYQVSTKPLRDDEITLMGTMEIRSKRIVVPGDQLVLTVTCESLRDNFLRFTGVGRVDGKVVTQARTSLIRKNIADLGRQLW
ncbi:beta-hydroxyacyl-ACP dehydratase [Streptomyces sp. NPDC058657]|uniref:beta-hydroxyacyl-ACP dehydratase n=1 Tax=unclassified Streptomyces TaxID=2593676 RepID=UPI00366679D3